MTYNTLLMKNIVLLSETLPVSQVYFRGSRFSQLFILSRALHCSLQSKLLCLQIQQKESRSSRCIGTVTTIQFKRGHVLLLQLIHGLHTQTARVVSEKGQIYFLWPPFLLQVNSSPFMSLDLVFPPSPFFIFVRVGDQTPDNLFACLGLLFCLSSPYI